MMTKKNFAGKKQRGVALLVALFALLLLSAIGLGMMTSANTETNINSNYREKQIAIYAASGGAWEGKDRLSSIGDIAVPAGLPSTGAANIMYIINPSGGETVAPWTAGSTYADTELCHENVMGLTTAALGTWCSGSSSLPASSGWYTALDNSDSSYTGAYRLSNPLSYKWVRIQLKANNSTPYPVDGDSYPDSSHSWQVCWNGYAQIPIPSGYKTDCTPSGALSSITLTASGSGYSSAPTVTISAPASGTTATATATIGNPSGMVASLSVTDGGDGYTSVPTVTISAPPSGTTATATATIVGAGSPVTSVTENNIGSPSPACWSDSAIAANGGQVRFGFSGGGGSGGGGTVGVSAGYNCVASMQFTAGTCSNPAKGTNNVSVSITGGGSGFVGSVNVPSSGHLSGVGVTVTNTGTGYTSTTPAVTFGTAGCSGVTTSAVLGHTMNTSSAYTLTSGGAGYTTSPALTFTPSPLGSTPSATANLGGISSGQVVALTLTNAGTGYVGIAPTVTISGGCPTSPCTRTATATASISGVVTGITINNAGSGYSTAPTVTLSAPGGGGTTATAKAWVQAGTYYAPVYLITALGVSPGGARSMVQMEAAPAIRALNLPGALTLAGPQPNFGAPNSNNFMIDGTDHPNGYVDSSSGATAPAPTGCDTTTAAPHPSIGVYDNPDSPTSPTSVATVLTDIPSGRAATNYPGLNASPDVQNVYGALGEQGSTPTGFESIISAISALPQANVYAGNQTDSTLALGSQNNTIVDVVNGNVRFNGNNQGYGILVVTGTITFAGNFTWNGIVLAIGQGNIQFSGGGGGTINGSVLVAKTRDSSGNLLSELGTPVLDWSGGGGNGIYYDHCYSDGLLSSIPLTVPVSSRPLKVLSIKTLSY